MYSKNKETRKKNIKEEFFEEEEIEEKEEQEDDDEEENEDITLEEINDLSHYLFLFDLILKLKILDHLDYNECFYDKLLDQENFVL